MTTPLRPVESLMESIAGWTAVGIPEEVTERARLLLLDLLGVAAAGTHTLLSATIREHAVRHMSAGAGFPSSPLLFDGRTVSPSGAALAGGMTIDALDAHDGHRLIKGHVGCNVLPAVLSSLPTDATLGDLLAHLVLGYELGTRAGIALHSTVADYHTSGAWGAVACAGVVGRILGLSPVQLHEALGIAEYHGPRSQMMRVIDHPTMLKDGSGWGAMAGTSAAWLAAEGFTGSPALTVAGADVADVWADFGEHWWTLDQYFKPQPICRWGQPAVVAALRLVEAHEIEHNNVASVVIRTFHEATRLATRRPTTTEEAQYSLPFPVAAALVAGRVGPDEVSGTALADGRILALADRVQLVEDVEANHQFPARRIADVTVETCDGATHTSGPVEAPGDPEDPLSVDELIAKFRHYAGALEPSRRAALEALVIDGSPETPVAELRRLVDAPLDARHGGATEEAAR